MAQILLFLLYLRRWVVEVGAELEQDFLGVQAAALAQAQIVLFTPVVQELLGKVTQVEVDSMFRVHTKVVEVGAAQMLLVQTLLGLQAVMGVPV
jgi:hypothetical protein